MLQRKVAEYEARYKQWRQQKEDYIAKHGQAAWSAKLKREIDELYPPDQPIPGNRDYTK